jgi:hypothetical protein
MLSDNLRRLVNLARRTHRYCEDQWYSCPRAEGGCADDSQGDGCNCGADAHNAEVDKLVAIIESEQAAIREGR